jgi:MFS family permease
MRKKSLLVIFLTVFIDLVGFGIVLPLLPIYSENFQATDLQIGLIIASYSAMQFLLSPWWGRLSDRLGRRPVLLISNVGSTVSYALFGAASLLEGASALWLLLASRVFAGICGANLSVANAYIADITPLEKRSKSMGLIGMAFGLGFIFGPALSSAAIRLFGISGPGWVAAVICAANLGLTWFILAESRQPGGQTSAPRPKFAQWLHTFRQPTVGILILIYFLATFCFASFESTYSRLVHRQDPNAEQFIGLLFTYCGLLAAVLQGGLIGRLVKALGEARLIFLSLLIFSAGLLMLPTVFTGWLNIAWILIGLGLVASGSGLNRPPTFGLISVNTPTQEQGATLGVAQSAGSLARILGPVSANLLYQHSPALPYYVCAAVSLLAGFLAWKFRCQSAQQPSQAARS